MTSKGWSDSLKTYLRKGVITISNSINNMPKLKQWSVVPGDLFVNGGNYNRQSNE